jgi:hypothetical protein
MQEDKTMFKIKRRALSLTLVAVLLVGALPMTASAAQTTHIVNTRDGDVTVVDDITIAIPDTDLLIAFTDVAAKFSITPSSTTKLYYFYVAEGGTVTFSNSGKYASLIDANAPYTISKELYFIGSWSNDGTSVYIQRLSDNVASARYAENSRGFSELETLRTDKTINKLAAAKQNKSTARTTYQNPTSASAGARLEKTLDGNVVVYDEYTVSIPEEPGLTLTFTDVAEKYGYNDYSASNVSELKATYSFFLSEGALVSYSKSRKYSEDGVPTLISSNSLYSSYYDQIGAVGIYLYCINTNLASATYTSGVGTYKSLSEIKSVVAGTQYSLPTVPVYGSGNEGTLTMPTGDIDVYKEYTVTIPETDGLQISLTDTAARYTAFETADGQKIYWFYLSFGGTATFTKDFGGTIWAKANAPYVMNRSSSDSQAAFVENSISVYFSCVNNAEVGKQYLSSSLKSLSPTVSTAVPEPPLQENSLSASPSKTSFLMNGQAVSVPEAYNVEDNNYLQLRGIAALLNGTAAQFDVNWDGTYAVIETGKPYSGETNPATLADTTNVRKSNTQFKIDGAVVTFDKAYYIDGDTNYLQLREFAKKLNGTASRFNVYWDGELSSAVIEPGKPYTGVK